MLLGVSVHFWRLLTEYNSLHIAFSGWSSLQFWGALLDVFFTAVSCAFSKPRFSACCFAQALSPSFWQMISPYPLVPALTYSGSLLPYLQFVSWSLILSLSYLTICANHVFSHLHLCCALWSHLGVPVLTQCLRLQDQLWAPKTLEWPKNLVRRQKEEDGLSSADLSASAENIFFI